MKTINRYIAVEVIRGSVVSIIVLLTIYNVVTFTDELGDLGKGAYGLWQIMQYLALTSPRNFYELMPTGVLIGTLFTLGAMGSNRELLAMRIAGVSLFRLSMSVLQAGALLAAITLVVGEVIAPEAEKSAQLLKAVAQKKQIALATRYGFWLRDANTFINVRSFGQGNELGDISVYEFDDQHKLAVASHVEQAINIDSTWHLSHIKQTYFEDHQISSKVLEKSTWGSLLDPEMIDIVVVKPDNLSILGLYKYIRFLKENGQKSQTFELAFWSRLVNPLVTLIMLLVAMPFVFRLDHVMNTSQRIVSGVLIGFGFYLFDRTFNHIALVYDINPIFTAFFPAVLVFTIAVIAIRKYC